MLCKTCKQEMPDSSAFCPWCGKKQAAAPRKALKRPNGAGSVYKLSGRRKKPWAASKNRVIIGYYEKKTDALAALEKLSGKSLTERYNMTFKEVVKAKLFCPEIAGLFCRIAGLFCHDSRANLSLKPVCFGIAIS